VYWRDRQTGETKIISNGFEGPFFSRNGAPAISPDARWVAFETTRPTSFIEPGLGDANSIGSDIVLHDTLGGTNTVISRNWAGTATGNGPSSEPQFSPDGRWLAFASFATDLTTNIPSGSYRRLFVHDLVQRTTLDVSFGPYVGVAGSIQIYAGKAVFSADSRFLAYNAPDNYVGLYDLVTGVRSNVCFQCKNPTMTADGGLLAVETFSGIAGGQKIMLIDRVSSRTSLIGTNAISGVVPFSIAPTRSPILGGDGRYLVFLASVAYDVVNGGTLRPRLYLRDLARGITQPLPIDLKGGSGDGPSYVPQLAGDGRTLVFASFAGDLVPGDYNSRRDVFAVRIGSPDTDHDGLDDDWEVAYFGDLSRDGTGDFDQDGQSDRREFLTGTDPTNKGSVLNVTLITSVPADSATILWQSVPGRVYDVQYKDALTDEWSTLFAHVVADTTTRSVVDNLLPRPEHRFYRVVFVPN
jgi:Tol biopolymer transport system component